MLNLFNPVALRIVSPLHTLLFTRLIRYQPISFPAYTRLMRLLLAPMEGVTDHHFRNILTAIGGVDLCVTEFVRVNDLPLPAKTLLRECPELPYPDAVSAASDSPSPVGDVGDLGAVAAVGQRSETPSGVPVRLQLLGSNPQTLAESATTAAHMGAAGIDLNFGCPAKTVNKSRGGSILLKEPRLVNEIVAAVRAAVPACVPVTAKIRLGYEDRSLYLDNAAAIADAGADELCVHARSRADGYKPPAYWSYISKVVEAVAIPVVANGEIWNVQDWQRCKQESDCDDFMLGRGLLACPDLALQIRASVKGESHHALQWPDLVAELARFYLATKDIYPKRFLGNRVKQWLYYLQMHYSEAEDFFHSIKRYKEPEQFAAAFSGAPKNGENMGMH